MSWTCADFLKTEWQPDLDHCSVKKVPTILTRLGVRAFKSLTNLLPGVLGIKWSPQNIGIAFTEMSSQMKDCLFPNLGIVRNIKQTDVFFNIPFPKRHTHSDTWAEKLEHVWSCFHTLSKPWENFMFLTILSIRNMSQNKGPFTHLFVTNLPFIFMWVHFVKNQLKIWKKLVPLTIDHSGYNEDSISFLIFSYLQWNIITTRFTSTKDFSASLLHRGLCRSVWLTELLCSEGG